MAIDPAGIATLLHRDMTPTQRMSMSVDNELAALESAFDVLRPVPPRQLLFCTMWGLGDVWGFDANAMRREWPAILDRIKALGYAGVEATVAHVMTYGSKRFESDLKARGLLWVADVFTSAPPPCPGNLGIVSEFGILHPKDSADTRDVGAHKAQFEAQCLEALQLRSVLRSINSHTGRDFFTKRETDDMFSFALRFEATHDVLIHHETHRLRIMYSPWVTREVGAEGLGLGARLSYVLRVYVAYRIMCLIIPLPWLQVVSRHTALKLCADYSVCARDIREAVTHAFLHTRLCDSTFSTTTMIVHACSILFV